ncbi:MAG: alpha/beta hydrolase [Desulfatiglandales bacterium]
MPVKWPALLLLIVAFGLTFRVFYPAIENFFVFFPDRSHDATPKAYGLCYKDVFFTTEDGEKLHGWFFHVDRKAPVILFCHGNAGNISHRLENIRMLVDRGLQVFIFDYRGYGKSSGRPSEGGLYRDGVAAYDYLRGQEGIGAGDIVLFGRSLGAAVSLEIALRKRVRGVIIESGFTSIKGMARTMFLFNILTPLIPAHYNNLEKVSKIDVPILIIHGEEDDIVPFRMGEKLFRTAKSPKSFYPLKGAGHNDTYVVGGPVYFDNLEAFARDTGDIG